MHLFVESVHKSWGILFLHIKFLDLVTDVKKTDKQTFVFYARDVQAAFAHTDPVVERRAPIFVCSDRPSPHPEEGPS